MNKGIWSANNLVKLQLDPNYVDGNFRDVTRLVFLKKKLDSRLLISGWYHMSKPEQVLNSLFQKHKTRNSISMNILLNPIPNNLECLIYGICHSHQSYGRWMKNFRKSCTQNDSCEGTCSSQESQVLPWFSLYVKNKIITRFQMKIDIPSK